MMLILQRRRQSPRAYAIKSSPTQLWPPDSRALSLNQTGFVTWREHTEKSLGCVLESTFLGELARAQVWVMALEALISI